MMKNKVSAWVRSMRPLGQANLFPFLFFGQALAAQQNGSWNHLPLYFSFVWLLLLHLLIVWINDLSDVEADTQHESRTFFSGGSGVLVDKTVSFRTLKTAVKIVFVLFWIFSIVFSFWLRDFRLVLFSGASCLLIWFYDLKPFHLSYRGFGEVIQGLGSVVLLLLGWCVQGGLLRDISWIICMGVFLLGHASHILTALPDVENDQRFNKRTLAVRWGVSKAVWLASAELFIGIVLVYWALGPFSQPSLLVLSLVLWMMGGLFFVFHNRQKNHPKALQIAIVCMSASWVLNLLLNAIFFVQ